MLKSLSDTILWLLASQMALEEDALSVDSTWTICAKNYLGESLRRKGQLEEAKKLLQQTRDGFRRAMGADHPETIGALADMGQVNLNLGLFEVAGDATESYVCVPIASFPNHDALRVAVCCYVVCARTRARTTEQMMT